MRALAHAIPRQVIFGLLTALIGIILYALVEAWYHWRREKSTLRNDSAKVEALLQQAIRSAYRTSRSTKSFLERFEALMEKSQVNSVLPYFNIVWFTVFAVVAFLFAFRLGQTELNNPVAGVMIGIGLCLVPIEGMRILVERNNQRMKRQVPNVLLTISNLYLVTNDIMRSFEKAAEVIPEPLRTPIRNAALEHQRGVPIEECLKQLKTRVENQEFCKFVDNVLLHHYYGGNLRDILTRLVQQSQDRDLLEKQRRAQTSSARMANFILIGLNVLLTVRIINGVPTISNYLLRTTTGRLLINGSILTIIFNFVFARKMISVD